MKAYYDRRAPEYDDWYEGRGQWEKLARAGWEDELRDLERTLRGLSPARTLDVACGTGYLTRWLPGNLVGLDGSPRMLAVAARRLPDVELVRGDGTRLPFEDADFERVVAAHFYGHLEEEHRTAFLREARRVARELVLVDASSGHAERDEVWEERTLNDGSRWRVYKRYFTGERLLEELGGGDVLHEGHWFVVVRSPGA